jgi:hypothetical protein
MPSMPRRPRNDRRRTSEGERLRKLYLRDHFPTTFLPALSWISNLYVERAVRQTHLFNIPSCAKLRSREIDYRNSSGGRSVDTRKFRLFILLQRSWSLRSYSPPLLLVLDPPSKIKQILSLVDSFEHTKRVEPFDQQSNNTTSRIPLEVADSQVNQSRLSAAGQLSVAMGNHKQGFDPSCPMIVHGLANCSHACSKSAHRFYACCMHVLVELASPLPAER